MFGHVQSGCRLRFLEKLLHVVHEFIVVEGYANSLLKLLQLVLLKKKIMALLGGCLFRLICDRKRFDYVNHEASGEIAAYKAQHLMIVKGSYYLVVGCRVEHLLDLLQEAFAVESCGTDEGIFSQQNVLTF